jgi:penicillin-binding protein 1A
MGIETKDTLGMSSAIGGGIDVNPLQMATAYATFVNGGTYIQPTYLKRIETSDGRVLYPSQNDVQVLVATSGLRWFRHDSRCG